MLIWRHRVARQCGRAKSRFGSAAFLARTYEPIVRACRVIGSRGRPDRFGKNTVLATPYHVPPGTTGHVADCSHGCRNSRHPLRHSASGELRGIFQYSQTKKRPEVQRLRFIRCARDLGFSLDRIGDLLKLWIDERRHSADVRDCCSRSYRRESRAAELRDQEVAHAGSRCEGNHRRNCPILEELGATKPFSSNTRTDGSSAMGVESNAAWTPYLNGSLRNPPLHEVPD